MYCNPGPANGVATDSPARLGTLDTGSPITLGQDPMGAYSVFSAHTLDNVGIWRRVLTPSTSLRAFGGLLLEIRGGRRPRIRRFRITHSSG
ncbi:MAG: hypothetical protein ABSH34_22900 [Verrucomicrobiota bacterium]|jgi:hypothetical protein